MKNWSNPNPIRKILELDPNPKPLKSTCLKLARIGSGWGKTWVTDPMQDSNLNLLLNLLLNLFLLPQKIWHFEKAYSSNPYSDSTICNFCVWIFDIRTDWWDTLYVRKLTHILQIKCSNFYTFRAIIINQIFLRRVVNLIYAPTILKDFGLPSSQVMHCSRPCTRTHVEEAHQQNVRHAVLLKNDRDALFLSLNGIRIGRTNDSHFVFCC